MCKMSSHPPVPPLALRELPNIPAPPRTSRPVTTFRRPSHDTPLSARTHADMKSSHIKPPQTARPVTTFRRHSYDTPLSARTHAEMQSSKISLTSLPIDSLKSQFTKPGIMSRRVVPYGSLAHGTWVSEFSREYDLVSIVSYHNWKYKLLPRLDKRPIWR